MSKKRHLSAFFIQLGTRAVKDGVTYRYTYNATGIRTRKMVGDVEHNYILDGANIIEDRYCGNTLRVLYDNENAVCGIVYNGSPYYFTKNLQGDIIAISDENANIVARYRYDAWGVCTTVEDTSTIGIANINPFRYRGYYLDVETGLYYLQSRYYDPTVGRFINADSPVLLSWFRNIANLNLFAYCQNNPIGHNDYLGFCPEGEGAGESKGESDRSAWEAITQSLVPVHNYDGFSSNLNETINTWIAMFHPMSEKYEYGAVLLRIRFLTMKFYCFGPTYKGFAVPKWSTVINGLYLSGADATIYKMIADTLGVFGILAGIDFFGFIHTHPAGDDTPGPSGPDKILPHIFVFHRDSVFPVVDYTQYESYSTIYYIDK